MWRDGEWIEIEIDDEDDPRIDGGPWRIDIEIGRLGDLVGPVDVEFLWADDVRERRTWDGTDRWVRWTEGSDHRLDQVVVDPDGTWALETRRADNYWRDEPAGSDPLWWFGGCLRLIGLLMAPLS